MDTGGYRAKNSAATSDTELEAEEYSLIKDEDDPCIICYEVTPVKKFVCPKCGKALLCQSCKD